MGGFGRVGVIGQSYGVMVCANEGPRLIHFLSVFELDK
jgi:hypothetical protein